MIFVSQNFNPKMFDSEIEQKGAWFRRNFFWSRSWFGTNF